jgi:hypothetical protein
MSGNLFTNQFNVALNVPAAEYIFQHFTQFARFTVVPSHSAQAFKYNLTSLTRKGGHHLERRILSSNCTRSHYVSPPHRATGRWNRSGNSLLAALK